MRTLSSLSPQAISEGYAAQTGWLAAQGGCDEDDLWTVDPDHASWVEGVESGDIEEPPAYDGPTDEDWGGWRELTFDPDLG